MRIILSDCHEISQQLMVNQRVTMKVVFDVDEVTSEGYMRGTLRFCPQIRSKQGGGGLDPVVEATRMKLMTLGTNG